MTSASAEPTALPGDEFAVAARQAYVDVDYETCRILSDKAMKAPSSKEGRALALLHQGLCNVAVGQVDAGREAFRFLLQIQPDAQLPAGLSPRFTSCFAEAKGALVGVPPIAIAIEQQQDDGGVRTLRVALTDPDGRVKTLAWRSEAAVQNAPVRAAAKVELEVPNNIDVTVEALDAAGGQLATVQSAKIRAVAVEQSAAAPVAAEGPPWGLLAGIGGGVGLLAVVAAGAALTYVALQPPTHVTLRSDVAFGAD